MSELPVLLRPAGPPPTAAPTPLCALVRGPGQPGAARALARQLVEHAAARQPAAWSPARREETTAALSAVLTALAIFADDGSPATDAELYLRSPGLLASLVSALGAVPGATLAQRELQAVVARHCGHAEVTANAAALMNLFGAVRESLLLLHGKRREDGTP